MSEMTAYVAGYAPQPSLQGAHFAARARSEVGQAPLPDRPSPRTQDEPQRPREAPPRWPRVFPGL